MQATPFIKKKIQNSTIVWLLKSNRYVQLEEPAWFVFSKTIKKYKAETIAAQCVARYGITPEESLTFVNDIRSGMEEMNQPQAHEGKNAGFPTEIQTHRYQPYSIRHYRFGENIVEFSYETSLFENYIHPLIGHLETTEITVEASAFELFAYDDQIVFRLKGEVKGVWTSEETHLVKGLIFMNLVNVMFKKTDDHWLMTVHASAITNGKKTILISAGPGCGKTTMAAMLQDRGFRLVSDDFVPIDRQTFHAWPFPIAMSVKQGSVSLLSSLYPDLEQKPLNYITPEKSVRYLSHEFSKKAFPVKEFIFIQYDPTVDFEWEKLDQVTGIKFLLDQSWISPTEGNAEILLDLLSKWSFYQLTYSNNQKALDTITRLFAQD